MAQKEAGLSILSEHHRLNKELMMMNWTCGLSGLWKITLDRDIYGKETRWRKKYANGKPHSANKEERNQEMIIHQYGTFST